MKVLFAVSNENISDSIIKKYQQDYKEIISSKNVYYFNAIAKELQKDKSYDRIVISEDLEPFANNNYEVIDKFIFEKLDNISDEATSSNGQDIPIILICADRRVKSEALLVKIFGIGIYSALIGSDRSVTNVCELINKPRSKKDAKVYYKIDSDDVDYKTESEGDVSEIEIQNILNHYKRLGKNEEQYVTSFDNIAAQYTDAQLRVICKFLPLNVKAVLESYSQKYQELITFGTVTPSVSLKRRDRDNETKYVPNSDYKRQTKNSKHNYPNQHEFSDNLDVIERNIGKSNLTKPVVIPSSRNISDVKKIVNTEEKPVTMPEETTDVPKEENNLNSVDELFDDVLLGNSNEPNVQENVAEEVKKRRGRPKKIQTETSVDEQAPKKRRGRPKKIQPTEETDDNMVLPGFDNEEESKEDANLFALGEEESKEQSGGFILPGFEEDEEEVPSRPETNINEPNTNINTEPQMETQNVYENHVEKNTTYNDNNYQETTNIGNLLTKDKKLVAFVGTSKNGTSFLVNNLADNLSKKGISTAILDLTKNKNSYYIYTQNEEELRKKAFSCIGNLKNGIVDGIQVNKNLTVYTSLPGEDDLLNDYQNVLKTLTQNYAVVLMDCDFNTNYGYFKNAQEIYLVQSFDILTIQPITAFLRDLKSKNILDPEKLRIVLNKVLRVRSVTERTIIGGMAFYNDPAMSFMTELFNRDVIQYCSIPFEEQTYSKYLEGLVNCQITTNGYSKNFMSSLEKLSNMVYPLLSVNDRKMGKLNSYNSDQARGFSNNMNDTLNKMKNNY